MAASTATAMGRSNPDPSFRTSAGARFTVIRLAGMDIPEFFSAVRTRSWASRTAEAKYPTMENIGMPSLTSASTVILRLSIPQMAAEITELNKAASFPTRQIIPWSIFVKYPP